MCDNLQDVLSVSLPVHRLMVYRMSCSPGTGVDGVYDMLVSFTFSVFSRFIYDVG